MIQDSINSMNMRKLRYQTTCRQNLYQDKRPYQVESLGFVVEFKVPPKPEHPLVPLRCTVKLPPPPSSFQVGCLPQQQTDKLRKLSRLDSTTITRPNTCPTCTSSEETSTKRERESHSINNTNRQDHRPHQQSTEANHALYFSLHQTFPEHHPTVSVSQNDRINFHNETDRLNLHHPRHALRDPVGERGPALSRPTCRRQPRGLPPRPPPRPRRDGRR